jgi:hypothetical protein
MNIRGRIKEAFKEDAVDSDGLKSYLTELFANWRQAELTVSRTIGFILLASAAFELLTRGIVSEVSVIFLRITNATPLITAVLPVVVAYLTLNLALLIGDIVLYSLIYDSVMHLRFASLYENNMHTALRPPGAILTGDRFLIGRGTSVNRVGRVALALIRIIIYLMLPVSFDIYAYGRLLTMRGLDDVFVWTSLGISAILIVTTILLFFDVMNWAGITMMPQPVRVIFRLNRRSPT